MPRTQVGGSQILDGTIETADIANRAVTTPKIARTVTTNSDGATVTFNISTSDVHRVTIADNRTLALSNDQDGDRFTIIITQDATGSRTVTWWSGISWQNGTTPTLTTTGNKSDVFSFLRLSSGSYYGFIAGQNY